MGREIEVHKEHASRLCAMADEGRGVFTEQEVQAILDAARARELEATARARERAAAVS